MTIQVPTNFKPRPYQLALFQAMDGVEGKPETRKRRAILRWHRRAGKDKCCWAYMVKEAAQITGNYFYVFPTKTMARQALWENIDGQGFKLLDHVPKVIVKRCSNQEMILELLNGSTIRVLGFDKDPDSIRGVACKGVVFSEFAFSDPESYKTMLPALRESRGWAIFNSTPNGRNHFYDMWLKTCNSPRWFASQLQTAYPDKDGYSALIHPEDLMEVTEEEGLTQDDVDREYGVSFSTGMKGSFYAGNIQKAYDDGRVGDFVYDDTLSVDTFWDLGVDDATSVWFRQKINNKIIFIDHFEESSQDLQYYVHMLQDKGYKYGTHYLPHDAHSRTIQTGNTTAEIFEDLLRETKMSADVFVLGRLSVQDGINSVRSRFSRYHFDAGRCGEALKKVEMYHRKWDKRRAVYLRDPVHDFSSHAADALRMEAISEDLRHDQFYSDNNIKVITDFDPFE